MLRNGETDLAPGEKSEDYSELVSASGTIPRSKELLLATQTKVAAAEALLVDPTPERVQQAEHLLDQAAADLQNLQAEAGLAFDPATGLQFELPALKSSLHRIRAVLEGALRVQWHRMRRTGSYIEAYTPAGKTKVCVPSPARLNIEV